MEFVWSKSRASCGFLYADSHVSKRHRTNRVLPEPSRFVRRMMIGRTDERSLHFPPGVTNFGYVSIDLVCDCENYLRRNVDARIVGPYAHFCAPGNIAAHDGSQVIGLVRVIMIHSLFL